jgi:hypothetical protein
MGVSPTLFGWVVLPTESNVTFEYPNASPQASLIYYAPPFPMDLFVVFIEEK